MVNGMTTAQMNPVKSESSTPTTKILSKSCPGCGTVILLPTPTGLFAFGADMDVYCDPCVKIRVTHLERNQRTTELRTRFSEALRRGYLTERFRDASWSQSLKSVEDMNPEAWKNARGWLRNDNLYIYGGIGTGKTFMALCALRGAFVRGWDVAEVTARRFCKVTDTFTEGNGTFEHWKTVDALLLDDIDKARWSLDRIDALWELLDARMAANRRTIVTGNVGPSDLLKMLRERTVDGDEKNTTRADAALERLKPVTKIELKGRSVRDSLPRGGE